MVTCTLERILFLCLAVAEININFEPRSQAPPSFPSLTVRKSGSGPGIFYHVSDVEGREKVERT